MLRLSNALYGIPIISIRVGAVIGTTIEPIIDPNDLKIIGWYCELLNRRQTMILQVSDVREIIPEGVVVDDDHALSNPEDLVRLEKLLKINYQLIEKVVMTDRKRRIGKVNDYTIDTGSFYITKLYVARSLLKSFNDGQVIIDRTQIIKLTDRRVIVKDTEQRAGIRSALAIPTN
jgi:sporulation protein YlmC with PRC-barrel domain